MSFITIDEFIGRFHPLLVHLPIGILLLACFVQWFALSDRYSKLLPAVPVIFFWGMIGAFCSCISGFFLSANGEYEGALLGTHQWLGVSVAIISVVLYIIQKKPVSVSFKRISSFVLIFFITLTGHFGGSITYGEDYLDLRTNNDQNVFAHLKAIPDIRNAWAYEDLVRPVLEARCYSCHGSKKQKGKLRMDEPEHLLKGGEGGEILLSEKPDESEMITRMLLPLSNKDHMPPKGKPQPGVSEIELLRWWISTGADFNAKVGELEQNEKIKPLLAAFQSGNWQQKEQLDVPMEAVEAGDTSAINKLRRHGVVVIPESLGSNYLNVNFIVAEKNDDEAVQLLRPLSKQIISIKLQGSKISDYALNILSECKMLTSLNISNTEITDKGIQKLNALSRLQSLNLVSTKVTAPGLMQLQSLKNLQKLYVYKTLVKPSELETLQKVFSSSYIDTGNYSLPVMASDTMVISLL